MDRNIYIPALDMMTLFADARDAEVTAKDGLEIFFQMIIIWIKIIAMPLIDIVVIDLLRASVFLSNY